MAVAPGTERFTISMNRPMRDKLDSMAQEYSMSRSAFISMLIKKKWEEGNYTVGKESGERDEG